MGIFRLGDTSSRTKYQINLYVFLLEEICNANSNKIPATDEYIYSRLFEEGYKRKKIPSKRSDVKLILKTLKWLNLIKTINGETTLTSLGKDIYRKIAETNFTEDQTKIFKYCKIDYVSIVFLSLFLKMEIPYTAKFESIQKNYSPISKFVSLIISDKKNYLEVDELLNFFRSSNDKLEPDLNTKDLTKYKFNKTPKNVTLFYKFVDYLYAYNKNEESNFWINNNKFYSVPNSNKIVKIIHRFVNKVDKGFLITKLSSTKKTKYLKNNGEYINNLINKLTIDQKTSLLYECMEEQTLLDDYLDINGRFLRDLSLGYMSNDKRFIFNENYVEFLKHLDKKFNFSNSSVNKIYLYDLFDDTDIVKEFADKIKMDDKTSENYLDVIPYDYEVCKKVIYLYSINSKEELFDFITDKLKLDTDIGLPTIIEYFIILLVWHKLYKKYNKISNFEVSYNGTLDSNLKPLRFASGNQPDGNVVIENSKNITLEVTLLTDSEALRSKEITPILRHALGVKKSNSLDTNLLFFYPKTDSNYVKMLLNTHRYEYTYKGYEENIKTEDYILLNVYDFEDIFSNKFKLDDQNIKNNYDELLKKWLK